MNAIEEILHCSCACPFWGKPDEDYIFRIRCDCGVEEFVCGHCLQAGRVDRCLGCARSKRADHRNRAMRFDEIPSGLLNQDSDFEEYDS